MILRRPYALLIKYFKVIHLVVCALIGYLIYRTSGVLDFFNNYASTVESVVGQTTIRSLLNGVSIVLPLFIVVISLVIIYLMRYKKKPVLFYIITIISYLFTIGVFYFTNGVLNDMYIQVVDIRVALLARDLITAVMIIEWLTLIIFAIRATGFDIKKFNFVQDLEDLNIDEKDREEFEINIEIDTDKLKRGWNRRLRHGKYVYKENKTLINTIVTVVIVILVGYGVYYFGFHDKPYPEGSVFSGNGFTMQIMDSYITDKTRNGTVLNEENAFVLISMKVTNNSITNKKFDSARPVLVIDGKNYYSSIDQAERFTEFGNAYYGEALDSEEHTYLFIYEVPKEETLKEMQFQYIDTGVSNGEHQITKIAIAPVDLTGTVEKERISLGQELKFDDTLLNGSTLSIKQIEIQDRFPVQYQFCLAENDCIDSTEYLTPSIDEYEKSILKVDGTLKLGDEAKQELSLAQLLEKYGKLVYTINGEEKISSLTLKQVTPRKASLEDTGYVEVLKEVQEATEIDLVLTIYNTTYRYQLR